MMSRSGFSIDPFPIVHTDRGGSDKVPEEGVHQYVHFAHPDDKVGQDGDEHGGADQQRTP